MHLTIYSWSDAKLEKALLKALKNDVRVRIILHPPLARKERIKASVIRLENAGAEVKIAKQNMHEKFLLVDDKVFS